MSEGQGSTKALTVLGNNGSVGIGTTTPGYKFHVSGDAAGTSWTNLSSREFKEDIQKVDETAHSLMLAKLTEVIARIEALEK